MYGFSRRNHMTTIAVLRYTILDFCIGFVHPVSLFQFCIVRTRSNASDTGKPGPGSPVVGLSAVDEGTTGND